MLRRNVEVDRRIIEALFAAYLVTTDESATERHDKPREALILADIEADR